MAGSGGPAAVLTPPLAASCQQQASSWEGHPPTLQPPSCAQPAAPSCALPGSATQASEAVPPPLAPAPNPSLSLSPMSVTLQPEANSSGGRRDLNPEPLDPPPGPAPDTRCPGVLLPPEAVHSHEVPGLDEPVVPVAAPQPDATKADAQAAQAALTEAAPPLEPSEGGLSAAAPVGSVLGGTGECSDEVEQAQMKEEDGAATAVLAVGVAANAAGSQTAEGRALEAGPGEEQLTWTSQLTTQRQAEARAVYGKLFAAGSPRTGDTATRAVRWWTQGEEGVVPLGQLETQLCSTWRRGKFSDKQQTALLGLRRLVKVLEAWHSPDRPSAASLAAVDKVLAADGKYSFQGAAKWAEQQVAAGRGPPCSWGREGQ
ncbi:hypothetical protein V8C86DRAFT_2875475 [Haematococcus lacustris]